MKGLRKLGAVILLAVLIAWVGLFGLGWYLSPQGELQGADAIIAISGGETNERVGEAVSLYEQGWSGTIVFSGAALEGTVSNAKSMRKRALELGVESDDIIIEEKASDTLENAKFTLDIVRELGADSVILVTSPYHQRRSSIIFGRVYPDDIEIINHSAKDSKWRRKAWWTSRSAFNITISEVLKIIYLEVNRDIS